MSIAYRNEHFWGPHGWIDRVEAHWRQTSNKPLQDGPVHLDFINDRYPNDAALIPGTTTSAPGPGFVRIPARFGPRRM